MLSSALCTQLACIWEVTARKPGNVHRFRDFSDTSYLDFLHAASAIAPVLGKAADQRVGKTVLRAVQATRQVVNGNVNLGIILLLAPLATVRDGVALHAGLEQILDELDVGDSRDIYEAIRLAQPGGLGQVQEQDIFAEPTVPMRKLMALAAERDLVARQYANGYRDIFETGLPALSQGLKRLGCVEGAIIECHLRLLAAYPDSLIRRKLGDLQADEASRRAESVLAADWPKTDESRRLLAELDGWLRADGNRRNPGTTADLVAACLFVALREGILTVPLQLPWSAGCYHD